MILVIDNYDSFTYNLVQYLGELGADMEIVRNDKFTIEDVTEWSPEKIVISPGPCTPREAGLSCDVIREFGSRIPIFGVCLGHQAIGSVYGGKVIRAHHVMHGKTSMIHHNSEGVFKGLSNPLEATRYHSLIVERESLPESLKITAWTDDNTIMGLRHVEYHVYGVQFHPESILTKDGKQILMNFLEV